MSTKVIDVTAQQNATCALTAAGEVYCWSDNSTGQIGVLGHQTGSDGRAQAARAAR